MKHQREQPRTEVIRTFLCIEIPDSIKERIGALQDELRRVKAQVSWTKPSNVHLTLKFLGGVESSRIDGVRQAVERAASGIGRFELEVSGTGCFPSPRSPRVLWVGLTNAPDTLKQLYSNLEAELAKLGFPKEKRKFSPHLTIGRLRSPENGPRVAENLIDSGFHFEKFEAKEVIVMRSDLKPTGSIYTHQSVVKLQ